MAPWNDVFKRSREVARTLKRVHKKTIRYQNNHGSPIDGWRLYNFGGLKREIEYYGDTDYKEVYGDCYLILGTDGVIYTYTLLKVENGRRGDDGFKVTVDESPSLMRISPQTLHPSLHVRLRSDDVMNSLNSLANGTPLRQPFNA